MTGREIVTLGELIRKVDDMAAKIEGHDRKLDAVSDDISQAKGALSLIRFLGVGGLSVAILALLRAHGG